MIGGYSRGEGECPPEWNVSTHTCMYMYMYLHMHKINITYKHYDAEEGERHTWVTTVYNRWRETILWHPSPLISSVAEADKPHESLEAIGNGIHQNQDLLDLSNINNVHIFTLYTYSWYSKDSELSKLIISLTNRDETNILQLNYIRELQGQISAFMYLAKKPIEFCMLEQPDHAYAVHDSSRLSLIIIWTWL